MYRGLRRRNLSTLSLHFLEWNKDGYRGIIIWGITNKVRCSKVLGQYACTRVCAWKLWPRTAAGQRIGRSEEGNRQICSSWWCRKGMDLTARTPGRSDCSGRDSRCSGPNGTGRGGLGYTEFSGLIARSWPSQYIFEQALSPNLAQSHLQSIGLAISRALDHPPEGASPQQARHPVLMSYLLPHPELEVRGLSSFAGRRRHRTTLFFGFRTLRWRWGTWHFSVGRRGFRIRFPLFDMAVFAFLFIMFGFVPRMLMLADRRPKTRP